VGLSRNREGKVERTYTLMEKTLHGSFVKKRLDDVRNVVSCVNLVLIADFLLL
jgi:hypothetical protein